MRKKLPEAEKKVKIAVTLHPRIIEVLKNNHYNISRAIEEAVYQKLITENKIETLKF